MCSFKIKEHESTTGEVKWKRLNQIVYKRRNKPPLSSRRSPSAHKTVASSNQDQHADTEYKLIKESTSKLQNCPPKASETALTIRRSPRGHKSSTHFPKCENL